MASQATGHHSQFFGALGRRDHMSNRTRRRAASILLLTFVLLSITVVTSSAQKAGKLEIEHWRDVLRSIKRELKEDY